MNIIGWFTSADQWNASSGIPIRIVEHLAYTGLTLLIATLIAVPIGLYVGHTGHGRVVVVALAGALRALPTLGLLTLLVLLVGIGLFPPIAALVVLTVPPLLAGTYAGIDSVDKELVDAARSMGMRERQVLTKVEIPNALPVIFGGFRTAVLQVIATATVAAYVNLGGLGRYLIDGLANSDYTQMLGGALLVAALALAIDGILAVVQRLVVSPGIRTSAGKGPVENERAGEEILTAGMPQGGTS